MTFQEAGMAASPILNPCLSIGGVFCQSPLTVSTFFKKNSCALWLLGDMTSKICVSSLTPGERKAFQEGDCGYTVMDVWNGNFTDVKCNFETANKYDI